MDTTINLWREGVNSHVHVIATEPMHLALVA